MRIDPKLIEEGYINVQKHPTYDYYIYNYSQKAQLSGHWVDDVKKCRGLILDGQGTIVARPFEKFHNWEEYEKIPEYKSFKLFDKMDGSLGILYHTPTGDVAIATRGSFISDQSKVANEILQQKYSHVKFLPQYTYLFEIIYPENRIVLDYHGQKDLVLLAIIDNQDGHDLNWNYVKGFAQEFNMPIVQEYFVNDSDFFTFKDLAKDNPKNREGFVVLFDTGLRIKIKFDDYKKLHRIIFNLSTKSLWESLKAGQRVEEYLAQVPDEFFKWGKLEAIKLQAEYMEIEYYCNSIIGGLGGLNLKDSMKAIAETFKKCKYQSVLFAMYKGKPYSQIIWKLIEPEYRRPYGGVDDEKS